MKQVLPMLTRPLRPCLLSSFILAPTWKGVRQGTFPEAHRPNQPCFIELRIGDFFFSILFKCDAG